MILRGAVLTIKPDELSFSLSSFLLYFRLGSSPLSPVFLKTKSQVILHICFHMVKTLRSNRVCGPAGPPFGRPAPVSMAKKKREKVFKLEKMGKQIFVFSLLLFYGCIYIRTYGCVYIRQSDTLSLLSPVVRKIRSIPAGGSHYRAAQFLLSLGDRGERRI